MKKYLIDTNIAIYYMNGKFNLDKKFDEVSPSNCFISEITLAELKFGVENSERKEKNREALHDFLSEVEVLPIFNSLDFYASEKARLRKSGTPTEDFDLLIGATAISNAFILVTRNVSDFDRMDGIEIKNWVDD